MSKRKGIYIKLFIPEELLEEIENYRRSLRRIPSRSEAIRLLIKMGLNYVKGGRGVEEVEEVESETGREEVRRVERVREVEGRGEEEKFISPTQQISVISEEKKEKEGEECILGIPLRTILRCALKVEEETGSIAILDLKRVLEGEVGREIATSDVVKIISELRKRGLLKERGFVRVLSEKARKMLG